MSFRYFIIKSYVYDFKNSFIFKNLDVIFKVRVDKNNIIICLILNSFNN